MTFTRNTVYFGDNLGYLKDTDLFPDESVDLIYLDPPLNPHRGSQSAAAEIETNPQPSQIPVPANIWRWNDETEARYQELLNSAPRRLHAVLTAMSTMLGHSAMAAYLVSMTPRLIQSHRILKRTGSLFFHCDPIASHYLKILLDAIFGAKSLVNEVVWKRVSGQGEAAQATGNMGRAHDIILFCRKADKGTFNVQYANFSQEYLNHFYPHVDKETGKRFRLGDLTCPRPADDTSYEWRVKRPPNSDWMADLENEYLTPRPGWEYKGIFPYNNRFWIVPKDELIQLEHDNTVVYTRIGFPHLKRFCTDRGLPVQDLWIDIPPVITAERMLPSQKPVRLLERIVKAASNPGDIILDPFCGTGPITEAIEQINREESDQPPRYWVAIDMDYLPVCLLKNRLVQLDSHPVLFDTVGELRDVKWAKYLAQRDLGQFQYWAMALVGARPWGGDKRKRGDREIDGVRFFCDEPGSGRTKPILVQVRGSNAKMKDIEGFFSALRRTRAPLGIYIMLEEPTREMRKLAKDAGEYRSASSNDYFPRIQLLTVKELLADADSVRGNPACVQIPGRTL